VGEYLPSYYFDTKSYQGGSSIVGDYFLFEVETEYEAAGGNVQTVGALFVDFDVEFANELNTSIVPFEIQLPYIAQP